MDINAQLAEGVADGERDGLARLVPDGVGGKLAGEQDRDVTVNGDVPRTDGGLHVAAGLGRDGRTRSQLDAA